jgi:tRNA-dihydrouridine synthase
MTHHPSPITHHGCFWHTLPRPIVGLSPMDGVTDAAFRLMVARTGKPDVIFTEFTNVGEVCRGPDYLLDPLRYSEEERPVVAQLYGKNPELFYQAAHVVCELGFDGLDINMGCPSKNVAASGSGAGLIRTPDLAHEIIRATRRGLEEWAAGRSLEAAGLKPSRIELIRAMNRRRTGRSEAVRRLIPLSVKTRIGYESCVVEEWIGHLLSERPAAISVHGRTLQQMYRGSADWSAIAQAVRLADGTGTLLLGNGDLLSMQDVMRRALDSGVQGVLVGRGAQGNPWFFASKERMRAALTDRSDTEGRSFDHEAGQAERFEAMLAHARLFESVLGVERFSRMRKHLGWYCKGFRGAAFLRGRLMRVDSSRDVERLLAEFSRNEFKPAPASAVMPMSCLPA